MIIFIVACCTDLYDYYFNHLVNKLSEDGNKVLYPLTHYPGQVASLSQD